MKNHMKISCPSWLKNCKFWKIFAISFAGILILGGIAFTVFEFTAIERIKPITKEKAGETAIKYINENLLQAADAKLKSIEKKNGIYLVKFTSGTTDYDSYISLDGRYLFPYGFDLSAKKDTAANNTNTTNTANIEKRDTPEVHLYTMSYCPYGNQAEEVMFPVVKLLGSKVKIEPHYVIYSNYSGGGPKYCLDKENKYCSMHGIAELNQDVRELCIYKYQPEKFWDYIMAVNTKCTVTDIETCWSGVAKDKGVDVAKTTTCQKNEAIALLANEVSLNEKYKVSGSPMLVINGAEFNGARTAEGYKTAICSAFNTSPEECNTKLGESAATAPSGGCN